MPSLPRYTRASGELLDHLSSTSGDQDRSVISRIASSSQSTAVRSTPLNGSHRLRTISTFSSDIRLLQEPGSFEGLGLGCEGMPPDLLSIPPRNGQQHCALNR